jgi:hypothetical protein
MADQGRRLSRQELERIYQSFSSPNQLNTEVGVARGEAPGQVHPELQRPIGEISQIDRYTDTRRMNPVGGAIYGGLLAPAWEFYKASAMNGPGPAKLISDLLANENVPAELQQFSVTGPGKTSEPSMANITAPIHGLISKVMESTGHKPDEIEPLPFDSAEMSGILERADPRLLRYLMALGGKK